MLLYAPYSTCAQYSALTHGKCCTSSTETMEDGWEAPHGPMPSDPALPMPAGGEPEPSAVCVQDKAPGNHVCAGVSKACMGSSLQWLHGPGRLRRLLAKTLGPAQKLPFPLPGTSSLLWSPPTWASLM